MDGNGDGRPVRVVIVEDHDLVREGLRALLDTDERIEVVGHAGTVQEASTVIGQTCPDVVLLDLRLGDEDGAEVSRHLRTASSPAKVLVISAYERPSDLRKAMNAGAAGYLLKHSTPALLIESIHRVSAGQRVIDQAFVPLLVGLPTEREAPPELTPRERQVLDLVAEGLSNQAVADQLGITRSTAQKHVESLFGKFGVRDRAGLVAKAFRKDYLA